MDTSALVRLIVAEPESAPRRRYLRRFAEDDLFTAALAPTKLVRAVADGGPPAIKAARSLLDSIDSVALTRSLLDDAATLQPPRMRSLDTIHLAAAQRAARSLRALLTYDSRMSQAAELLGMPCESPR
jgi:predicted nucleic acid-binding protein